MFPCPILHSRAAEGRRRGTRRRGLRRGRRVGGRRRLTGRIVGRFVGGRRYLVSAVVSTVVRHDTPDDYDDRGRQHRGECQLHGSGRTWHVGSDFKCNFISKLLALYRVDLLSPRNDQGDAGWSFCKSRVGQEKMSVAFSLTRPASSSQPCSASSCCPSSQSGTQ
jgi:hypothetical protein